MKIIRINKLVAICLAMAVTIPTCTAIATVAEENPMLPYKEVMDDFNDNRRI